MQLEKLYDVNNMKFERKIHGNMNLPIPTPDKQSITFDAEDL